MDTLMWFILFFLLVCILYWYSISPYSYWERLGIPSPPAKSFVGTQMAALFKPLQEVELEWYKTYGRVYGIYEGRKPVLTVADPELLKNILVKDFPYFVNRRVFSLGDPVAENMLSLLCGERWKRIRNLVTPAFSTGKIRKMTSIILDSAKTLCENFGKAAEAGKYVDTKNIFGAFTMDVIARTAFATKIDSHNDPENKFVVLAKNVFGRGIPLMFVLVFFFPILLKLKVIRPTFIPKDASDFFTQVTLEIIEERKRTGKRQNDFLQLMMEAAGELEETQNEEKEEQNEYNEPEYKTSTSQKGMSREELIAQCVSFFVGGYETAASTLSFASYCLATNPDCQERLIQEIDEMLSNNKGNITYEGIQSMKYLDSVVSETLRLYPPAVRLDRTTVDEYDLGYADLKLPKGMVVVVPVYAMHHDPEFYPDPEKFDPDRFSPEAKAALNPYTYLPFGAGPRNCLGMRFALMEVKICLAQLFSQFRVKRCPETKVPIEFRPGQGLLLPKPIILGVEKRTDKKF